MEVNRYRNFLIILSFSPLALYAKPNRERTLESAHSYGRGGTFAAAFESDESYRQNPASLTGAGKNLTFQTRGLDGDVFFSKSAAGTMSKFSSILSGSPTPISILQEFTDKFGEYQYVRAQESLGFRLYSFDTALFVSTRNELDGRIPAAPEASFTSDTIVGWNIGYAFDVGKNISIGLNLRPFSRFHLNTNLDFAEILTFEPLGTTPVGDLLKPTSGSGIATDLGLLYKITPDHQFGIMVDDIGYTSVSGMPIIKSLVSLGWALRSKGKPWHSEFSIDLKDITNPEGFHMLRMLNMGWEFGRQYISRKQDVGVMLGLQSGWLSLGAYVNLFFAKFEVINYGVELGEYPGQRADRRWALSLKSSLDL
ncbi:MAG: hypothetical protein AB8C84_00800 [Oligoflexales bacterium]